MLTVESVMESVRGIRALVDQGKFAEAREAEADLYKKVLRAIAHVTVPFVSMKVLAQAALLASEIRYPRNVADS